MLVTIWRHGQAGSAASDRERQLTALGRTELAHGSRQYLDHCAGKGLPVPASVLHSAWLRTTQSAGLICEALGGAPMLANDALLPGRRVTDVEAMLADLQDGPQIPEHLLLVSHQPLVSRLADHLLGDFGRVPPLPPGGLVVLSLDVPAGGCAQLLFWAMPPAYEACV